MGEMTYALAMVCKYTSSLPNVSVVKQILPALNYLIGHEILKNDTQIIGTFKIKKKKLIF